MWPTRHWPNLLAGIHLSSPGRNLFVKRRARGGSASGAQASARMGVLLVGPACDGTPWVRCPTKVPATAALHARACVLACCKEKRRQGQSAHMRAHCFLVFSTGKALSAMGGNGARLLARSGLH